MVRALAAAVRADLDGALATARAAYDEATHAESKAENKYDTRSLEASYLARGQAERVGALRRLLAFYEALDPTAGEDGPVGLGALVALEDEAEAVRWCFVAPDGGGQGVTVDGVPVRVVTPSSPLGAALMGARADDAIEVEEPRRQELVVVEVLVGAPAA